MFRVSFVLIALASALALNGCSQCSKQEAVEAPAVAPVEATPADAAAVPAATPADAAMAPAAGGEATVPAAPTPAAEPTH